MKIYNVLIVNDVFELDIDSMLLWQHSVEKGEKMLRKLANYISWLDAADHRTLWDMNSDVDIIQKLPNVPPNGKVEVRFVEDLSKLYVQALASLPQDLKDELKNNEEAEIAARKLLFKLHRIGEYNEDAFRNGALLILDFLKN